MLKSIFQAFVKKALYGCAGALAAYLAAINSATAPADPGAAQLWALIVVPVVTGAAGAVSRWATFDPTRAAK